MVICDQTGTPCQHGNDCLLRGVCRLIPNHGLGNLIASQPYSTNQAPAAPSLEQLMGDLANVVITPHHKSDEAIAKLATEMAQSIHRDAARYRKVRAMHASDLESYAWGAENADEFDKMIDDHE